MKIVVISDNHGYFKEVQQIIEKESPFEIIDIPSHRILLEHGHRLGVKTGYDRIVAKAKENGCDIALYGHTHVPEIEEQVKSGKLKLKQTTYMKKSIVYGNLVHNNPLHKTGGHRHGPNRKTAITD